MIIDDHPLFRLALRQALGTIDCINELIEANNFTTAFNILTQTNNVSLVVLDLLLPDTKGYEALITLRRQCASLPIVIISSSEDPSVIQRCIAYGALGYLPKNLSLPEISQAVIAVLNGDIWVPPEIQDRFRKLESDEESLIQRITSLTPTQLRVFMAIADGFLNKQIAYEFNISETTVKTHVSQILRKLNVNTRTQAVLLAQKLKIELPNIN